MPPRRRRKRRKPAPVDESSGNLILYSAIGLGGLLTVGAGVAFILSMQEKRSKKKETGGKKLSVKDIQQRCQRAGEQLMSKGFQADIPESLELRQLASTNLDNEDPEAKLYLAKFLQFRAGTLKNLDTHQEAAIINKLLKFPLDSLSDDLVGEWIMCKFKSAMSCKNLTELTLLQKRLELMPPSKSQESYSSTQLQQTLLKLACIFGEWEKIIKYGDQIKNLVIMVNDPQNPQKARKVPLLSKFLTEARSDPENCPNYYIFYENAKGFQRKFSTLFQGNLRFTDWKINEGKFNFKQGKSAYEKMQQQLDFKKDKEGWQELKLQDQKAWMFGAICQMKLKVSNELNFVLCGPWNDSDMCLTGSMVVILGHNPMRVEVTLTLERGKFQPKVGKMKNSWLWTGSLILERYLGYSALSQEIYDFELLLEEAC